MITTIRQKLDGKIASVVGLEKFATLEGHVLTVNLEERYTPRPRGSRRVEVEGNQVNLDLLGIDTSAQKLARYWRELEDRKFKLSKIVQTCLSAQAHEQAARGIFPAFPSWTPLLELIGLMYYFENRSGHPKGLRSEFDEIREQLNGVAGSNNLRFSDYERRVKIGIPQLLKAINSFASELRFAYELSAAGFGFTFKTEGGNDLQLDSNPRVDIEVTKRSTNFRESIKKREVSIPKAIATALMESRKGIRNKLKKNPDIVAVDISSRQSGFELIAPRLLRTGSFFEFEHQLKRVLRIVREKTVVLFFVSARSLSPFTDAIPFPLPEKFERMIKRI